ncbi:MAG: hypothetical protein AAF222_12965 [Pseudomonadota bacterium]
MAQKTKQTLRRDTGRTAGNLYDRLDAARQQRAEVLAPLEAANDDHRTGVPSRDASKTFPTLKPARREARLARTVRRWDWLVPWVLGALIVALMFGFAVS